MVVPDGVSHIDAIKAVESLRAGVPNATAVRLLGTDQQKVVDAFLALLEALDAFRDRGFLIEGGFGTGKSHLLMALRDVALRNNFACSIVAVSKEMTLGVVPALFSAAIRELRLPDKLVGGTCAEFLDHLPLDSSTFAALLADLLSQDSDLDPAFGASLQIYDLYHGEIEAADVLDEIIDFWDGERCRAASFKQHLRAANQEYRHLRQPRDSSLGMPRFSFVERLLRCAGYSGWVLLIDEGELIAKMSLLQRARAYATLLEMLRAEKGSPIRTVVAITDDLRHLLFEERDDRYSIDVGVRYRHPELADTAVGAIDFIQNSAQRIVISEPSETAIRGLHEKVKDLYCAAYPEFDAQGLSFGGIDRTASIRTHIKYWMTALDLHRLYPKAEIQLQSVNFSYDLTEDDSMQEEASVEPC